MADAAGIFRRPFAEQVAAFRLRLADLRPTRAWTDLWQAEHDRAFMVAGALKADLLADLAAAVQKAIEEGTGIERFRADFREIVERHGWHGWTGNDSKRGRAWRTKVIYKTNMATTYAAGRWAQLMKAGYPLLVYRHGGSLEPRPEHLSWDGLILPVDHPFWRTHAPPNGWGCSCFVTGARSVRDAVRKGGNPGKRLPDGWAVLNPKTGAPDGIDRGWAYAPGASVAEDIAALTAKLQNLPVDLGVALGETAVRRIDEAWSDWIARAMAGERVPDQLVGTISKEVSDALAALQKSPASAEILMRAGLVHGPKARRHAAKGDALSEDQWRNLPALLRSPRAVLRDENSGALIYLLAGDSDFPQIAVRLDYPVGRRGVKQIANVVVSAYRVRPADVIGRVTGGLLTLILGRLG